MPNIAESLARQREQMLMDGSEEALSRHTSLLEIAVISLYNRMINRLNLDSEQFRSSGAILAVGALGRGLIGPHQPVPILFLKSNASPWKETWVDEILMPLVEAGWTVAPLQGTPETLTAQAGVDLGVLLKLLEMRYISGNRLLVEDLDKALDELLLDRRSELLAALFESLGRRSQVLEDPGAWIEPDLDGNPGGLATISEIRAACRIAANLRSLEDAIFGGYLTREEVDHLQKAEKTFSRLISLVQTLPDGSGARLGFDQQEVLAKKLGYAARSGFLAVEAFMQHVFQLLHGVFCVAREFWERLHESREDGGDAEDVAFQELETGIVNRGGRIAIQTDRYPSSPGNLVHLFTLAARHRLRHANVTRQWIRHHANSLGSAAGDESVRAEFFELIRIDGPELRVLRDFYDQGLMSALIPELTAVHGLVQHDAFHLYPLQEHHFRTLAELKRLIRGDHVQDEPVLSEIARNLQDPTWLFLAALLHDIGKGSGRGHAARGAEMMPAIARRLGLNHEEGELLQFLVGQHLLLMDNASLRDLADQEMLSACKGIIGVPERLELLAVLSFADMAATGPKGLQKWRDTPVVALYDRLRHLLEKGEPDRQAILERMDQIRHEVWRHVGDWMTPEELENCFSNLAPRYILAMKPETIARHLRLERVLRRSAEPLAMEVSTLDGASELTLVSWEMTGLVSRSAGILTLHGMDIREAQVFTMSNDMMILIFRCRSSEATGREPDWELVKADMKRLLQGRMALSYRIAAHAATRGHVPAPVRRTPSQVLVDNESNAMYTIIEVYTLDRPGLLYTLTRTLFELQIRIFVAKITTKVDQVADVFYVKTQDGEKVTDPEQIREVKQALLFWLDEYEAGHGGGGN